MNWVFGPIRNKTIFDIFDNISSTLRRNNFHQVCFTLENSEGEHAVVVTRGNEVEYNSSLRMLDRGINDDLDKGLTSCEIFLEAVWDLLLHDINWEPFRGWRLLLHNGVWESDLKWCHLTSLP